jgi:alpha/beta superfamily hydrolase
MTSLVTSELFRLLPGSGLAALRFNFRGVGTSEGEHDFGRGEVLDVLAAIDAITTEAPGLPVVVCGWSFGADVSLSVTDPRISAWIACAPPLRVVPRDEIRAAAGIDRRPKLLIIPEHDQFLEPDPARDATIDWIDTEIVVVNGADHFFVGRTDKVAALVAQFVTRLS